MRQQRCGHNGIFKKWKQKGFGIGSDEDASFVPTFDEAQDEGQKGQPKTKGRAK